MKETTTGKYAALYRDPRWQKKRLEVMERDDFTCRSCGSKTKTLNVHHAYYEKGKKPWEYPSDVLITWCEDCHRENHATIKEIQAQLIQLGSGDLENLNNLLAMCGPGAAVEALSNEYIPNIGKKKHHLPVSVRRTVLEYMDSHSEAFMVLFYVMWPDPILEAIVDANADCGFTDYEMIAGAITMLARCYQQAREDESESMKAESKNEG